MAMAAEMRPTSRIHLFHVERKDEWQVWELVDAVPPSTQLELGPELSPDQGCGQSKSAPKPERHDACLPALVMEVSEDGEITTWPGPDVA